MMKKITVLFMVFVLLLPSFALAKITNLEYMSGSDSYNIYFDSTNVSYFTFTNNETKNTIRYEYAGVNYLNGFKCNTTFTIKFYNASGELLTTSTEETTQIKTENSSCTPTETDPPPEPEPEETCDSCSVLDCPAWGDYMGKIDELIGKIPPPPDWDNVAKIFRDTILTKWKSDMQELIGTPDEQPTPPAQQKPKGSVLDEPTGQKAPGFDESGFTAEDIKSSAPVIEERPDASGGFEILDPIDSLPTQEEFKQNIPNEPEENLAPAVPDVPEDNTAPAPPEQDNPAPGTPEEQDNPAPGAPTEQDNPLPSAPEEQPNPTPGAPEDNNNTAPLPPEGDNTAPTPTEPENPTPTPGDTGGSAPIPGGDTSTAPLPGDLGDEYPIPPPDGSTAPTP